MSKENILVAAHFLRISQEDLSFEAAFEIVKKEFSEKGSLVRKDIYITSTVGKLEICLGCHKVKSCYGDDKFKFCAKCMLPKDIYEKYLKPSPVKIEYIRKDPVLINKLHKQISSLINK